MKLQLALDDLTLEEALDLVESIQEDIDIIEIGTPMIYQYGMAAVRQFARAFGKHEILADLKIMDAGQYEAGEAFEAGAQMTTVLGVSDLATIADCIKCAGQDHEVFVDLICVQDLPKRVDQLRQIGARALSVHVGVDQQAFGLTPLAALQELKTLAPDMTISVAGGIHETTIQDYIRLKPDIVIVGSGITHAPDPQKTAHALAQAIRNGD